MEPLYVHLAIWLFPVSKPNIQIQIETPFGKWQFHGSFSNYCELCSKRPFSTASGCKRNEIRILSTSEHCCYSGKRVLRVLSRSLGFRPSIFLFNKPIVLPRIPRRGCVLSHRWLETSASPSFYRFCTYSESCSSEQ